MLRGVLPDALKRRLVKDSPEPEETQPGDSTEEEDED